MQEKVTFLKKMEHPGLDLQAKIQPHIKNSCSSWSAISEIHPGTKQLMMSKEAERLFFSDGRYLNRISTYCALFIYRPKNVRGKTVLSRELLNIFRRVDESITPLMPDNYSLKYLTLQLFDANGKLSSCIDCTHHSYSLFDSYTDAQGTKKISKVRFDELGMDQTLSLGEVDGIETNTWLDGVSTLAINEKGSNVKSYCLSTQTPNTTSGAVYQQNALTFTVPRNPTMPIFVLQNGNFVGLQLNGSSNFSYYFVGGNQIEYDSIEPSKLSRYTALENARFLEKVVLKAASGEVIMQKTFFEFEHISPHSSHYHGKFKSDSLDHTLTATYDREGNRTGIDVYFDKINQMQGFKTLIEGKCYAFEFNHGETRCLIENECTTIEAFLKEIQQTVFFSRLMQKLPLGILIHILLRTSFLSQTIFGETIGPVEDDFPDELTPFSIIKGPQHWHHYHALFERFLADTSSANGLFFAISWLQKVLPLLIEKKPIPVSIFHDSFFIQGFGSTLPIVETLVSKKIALTNNLNQELRSQLITQLKPHLAWIMRRLKLIYECQINSNEQNEIYSAIQCIPQIMQKIEQEEAIALESEALHQKGEMFLQATNQMASDSLLMSARDEKTALHHSAKLKTEHLLQVHVSLRACYALMAKNEFMKLTFMQTLMQIHCSLMECLTKETSQRSLILDHAAKNAARLTTQELKSRTEQLEAEQTARAKEARRLQEEFKSQSDQLNRSVANVSNKTLKQEKEERSALLVRFHAEEKVARIAYAKTFENCVNEEKTAFESLRQQKNAQASFLQVAAQERCQREQIGAQYQLQTLSIFSKAKSNLQQWQAMEAAMLESRKEITAEYRKSTSSDWAYARNLHRLATYQSRRVADHRNCMLRTSFSFLLQGNAFNPQSIRADMEDCFQSRLSQIKSRDILKEYFCCSVFALCHAQNIPIILEALTPQTAIYLNPEAIQLRQEAYRALLRQEVSAHAQSQRASRQRFKTWGDCEVVIAEGAQVYLETLNVLSTSQSATATTTAK